MPRAEGFQQAALHLAAALGSVAAQSSEIEAHGLHRTGSSRTDRLLTSLAHSTTICTHDPKTDPMGNDSLWQDSAQVHSGSGKMRPEVNYKAGRDRADGPPGAWPGALQ